MGRRLDPTIGGRYSHGKHDAFRHDAVRVLRIEGHARGDQPSDQGRARRGPPRFGHPWRSKGRTGRGQPTRGRRRSIIPGQSQAPAGRPTAFRPTRILRAKGPLMIDRHRPQRARLRQAAAGMVLLSSFGAWLGGCATRPPADASVGPSDAGAGAPAGPPPAAISIRFRHPERAAAAGSQQAVLLSDTADLQAQDVARCAGSDQLADHDCVAARLEGFLRVLGAHGDAEPERDPAPTSCASIIASPRSARVT